MKSALPVCASLLLLSACVARGPESLLRDKDAYEPARLAAVAQISNPVPLWRAVDNAGDLLTVRQAAASRLWALDGDAFWKRLERDHKDINHGSLWTWLCAEAGKARERRALRTMVLSWGRLDFQVGEAGRPENAAVAQISGQVSDAFLAGIVKGREMTGDQPAQRAAWMALARKTGSASAACRTLAGDIPADSALRALRMLAEELSEFPVVDEELDTVVAQLALPRRPHAPVPPRDLPLARRNLLGISSTAAPSKGSPLVDTPVPRTTDAPLLGSGRPCAADEAVCANLRLALASPGLVRRLFEEADADRDDGTTEHGGLFLWNAGGEVVFASVRAMTRRHDNVYLPPESLFEQLRDGLAHVHFHAQKYDNGEYAGPGKGDLEFIERNRVNGVVFTFIDKDTLDVDAYFPGKIVVDLGCVKRPK